MTPPEPPPTGPLVIDAANVIGSVPDGWWRDRRAAAQRLRDRVARAVGAGLLPADDGVVLVVEGKARGIEEVPGVPVVSATGSGDDTIVALVRELSGNATVVTADRALRERVAALGARVIGPRTLQDWLNAAQQAPH
jgi:hypothetical protein